MKEIFEDDATKTIQCQTKTETTPLKTECILESIDNHLNPTTSADFTKHVDRESNEETQGENWPPIH